MIQKYNPPYKPHLYTISDVVFMNPRLRVLTKVGAFSFALFFIFFFVVHGYRYTNGVGFVTKNAFYEGVFWSNNKQLSFDKIAYNPTDNKVQLYNLDVGCYNVEYNGETSNQCVYKNSVTFDTFVTYKKTVQYKPSLLSSCKKVDREKHGEYSINGMTYATPIQAVFSAREVPFMQTNNKIFSCTSDYKKCRELMDVDGDVVCSVKEGLVYNKDGKLFLAELE